MDLYQVHLDPPPTLGATVIASRKLVAVRQRRYHYQRLLAVVALSIMGSTLIVSPSSAAPTLKEFAVTTLSRETGVGVAQARSILARQQLSAALAERLQSAPVSPGSYLDRRTGDLVVNVLDAQAAAAARAAGAHAVLVKTPKASLDAIHEKLNAAARQGLVKRGRGMWTSSAT